MNRCGWYILLLVLQPMLLLAQEKVVIKGVVVDADSSRVLSSVHLQVKRTSRGGVTNAQGYFNVRVDATDTIVFTRVGYAPQVLVAADSSEQARQSLTIRMKPKVTVLDEVRFRDYGDLTKYIRREYDTTVSLKRSKGVPLFERKEPKEQKAVQLSTGPNGAALSGAVTAFANLFSDEFQQRKKLKEEMEQEEAINRYERQKAQATRRFQELTLSVPHFDSSRLAEFTEKYMPDVRFINRMSDYALTLDIIRRLEAFNKEGRFLEDILQDGTFEGQ